MHQQPLHCQNASTTPTPLPIPIHACADQCILRSEYLKCNLSRIHACADAHNVDRQLRSISKLAKGVDAMVSLILYHGVHGLSDSDNKQHVAEAPFHTSAIDLLLVSAACIFASHPYAV